MLSAEDQARFSRHLLLDALGGKGQERICAGTVEIALPGAFSNVAVSCARALAAGGVRRLVLRGPWARAASTECQRLAPSLEIASSEHDETASSEAEIVSSEHEGIVFSGREASASKASSAHEVAEVKVSIVHEPSGAQAPGGPRGPGALTLEPAPLTLDPTPPREVSEAHALGALAAVEALKLLAGTGHRAPLPLSVFPARSPPGRAP